MGGFASLALARVCERPIRGAGARGLRGRGQSLRRTEAAHLPSQSLTQVRLEIYYLFVKPILLFDSDTPRRYVLKYIICL